MEENIKVHATDLSLKIPAPVGLFSPVSRCWNF